MSAYSRTGFKWSVNEILSLQREFELLGWSIDDIAVKHKRTPNAIMFKLDQEGFADYNVLYSNYNQLNTKMSVGTSQLSLDFDDDVDTEIDDCDKDEEYVDNGDEDEDEDENEDLTQRVNGLEESVSEIRDMIKEMMSSFTKSPSKGWFSYSS